MATDGLPYPTILIPSSRRFMCSSCGWRNQVPPIERLAPRRRGGGCVLFPHAHAARTVNRMLGRSRRAGRPSDRSPFQDWRP